jgi:hypothetical protein
MSGDSPVVIAYDGSELSRQRGPGGGDHGSELEIELTW